ncbi:MAG TPA: GntR family transcriptional regulator [Hyphomicrobiaceae bacterium]|nr:GntR family transcriptional regulator [Hyphomicrobiaceae bacterium]
MHIRPTMTVTVKDTDKRPRYLHVRDRLVERIQSGSWGPGQPIPSELDIAQEFGVSQGTARMAVATLAMENVVVRRQGLGTFVFEHTPDDELSRFSCLFDAGHERIGAGAGDWRPLSASATRIERRALHLPNGSRVLRISRVRTRKGKPFALERISLPETRFPWLASRENLPGTLYEIYQKDYGVHVVEAEERLTAVIADRTAARDLKVAAGAPLLRIERVAVALGGEPVEWRVSLCYLTDAHYRTRLR